MVHEKNPQLPNSPKCPTCQTILDGYTHIKLQPHKMKIDDYAVCSYCGTVLQYKGRTFGFRKVEGQELFLLRLEHPALRKAEEAVRQLKAVIRKSQ